MNLFLNSSNKEFYTFGLCIIVFLLPYSITITNIFIIILSLCWLKDLITGKHMPVIKANFTYILPFILLFLAYLVSILYSADVKEAFSTIERRIPVLLLPLIIFSTPFNRKNVEAIFLSLTLSVAACCTVALVLTISYFVSNPLEYYLEKALWYLPQTIGFHAPYLALYIVISNILCAYFLLHKQKRVIVTTIFILNNIFLFLISSRSALAVNWLLISTLSSYYFFKSKGLIISILNLLVIGCLCYIAYIYVPYLHTKLSKLTEASFGLTHRAVAAKAALEVIKDNPLVGVGIGDIQNELNKELSEPSYKDMNVHNQYLHEMMTYGLVGFTAFLSVFIHGFYKAIRNKDLFFFLFLISFMMLFLTEVILSRYQGVILFSLFYPLFLSRHNIDRIITGNDN